MSYPVSSDGAGHGSILGSVLLLTGALLTSACGDPTTPRDVPRPRATASAAASASASAATLTVTVGAGPIVRGVTLPVTATITGRPTPLPNASLTWRSSNEAVATVSPAGVITAVALGKATITATLGAANQSPSGAAWSAVGGTKEITVTEGAFVSPQAGGTVSGYAGDVTLVLPAGALTTPTPITVTVDPTVPTAPNAVGSAYEFGPAGTEFAVPVEIALKYTLPPGTDPNRVRVARLEDGAWVPLTEGVSVDPSTSTVRAFTRHFSHYAPVVSEPCAPKDGTPPVISETITGSDCLFVVSADVSRHQDYFQMVPPANTVTVIKWDRNFAGVFGMKEATADAQAGLVFGSIVSSSELRIVGNGDKVQLFVSGAVFTTEGAYTLTKSAAVGHACYTAAPLLYIVPGASYQDAVTAQNSCAFNIRFSPFAAVIGKPILAHYLVAKLDAGKQYTISVSGMPGQSALTIFRSGAVAAQNVGPTVGGVRTVTVTPVTAGNYTIEISSGGFQFADFTGAWLNPVINYTLSVSRGVTPTP